MTTRQIRKLTAQQLEAALDNNTITLKQYNDECAHRSVNRKALNSLSEDKIENLLSAWKSFQK